MMIVDVRATDYKYNEPIIVSSKFVFDIEINQHCDWLNNPISEKIVQDVDRTEHVKDFMYNSPFLGVIPPQMLSGGSKALILIANSYNPEIAYSSKIFGDNCVEWLRRLSFLVDFKLLMCHPLGWASYYGKYVDHSRNVKPRSVNAMTVDGKPLTTNLEVSRYFIENYQKYLD